MTLFDTSRQRVRTAGEIELPARETLTLESGGLHVMLMGVGSLLEGDSVEITLLLETSGSLDIVAEVRAF